MSNNLKFILILLGVGLLLTPYFVGAEKVALLSEGLGILIVLLPVIIFLIVIFYLTKKIGEDKIKLIDLLAEPDASLQKTENESETPAPKRSTSRFILFLTGITTVTITVCFTTYYFYMKIYCINCEGGLDLQDFTNVLLALGIGVVPYTVNQVKKVKL